VNINLLIWYHFLFEVSANIHIHYFVSNKASKHIPGHQQALVLV